jgi:hypothetical protein
MKDCQCCRMKSIEDEYHFVIICPAYRHLCLRYLPKYYCSWPKISIFLSLIETSSRPLLFELYYLLNENWMLGLN